MLESRFQSKLIEELRELFPGCVVLKTDSSYIQGFPDLVILYGKHWAALECKESSSASRRPNQEYYVDMLGDMSYASFVYPGNKVEVLHDLQRAFTSRRPTRVSQRF